MVLPISSLSILSYSLSSLLLSTSMHLSMIFTSILPGVLLTLSTSWRLNPFLPSFLNHLHSLISLPLSR